MSGRVTELFVTNNCMTITAAIIENKPRMVRADNMPIDMVEHLVKTGIITGFVYEHNEEKNCFVCNDDNIGKSKAEDKLCGYHSQVMALETN